MIDEILEEILDKIFEDCFGSYDTSHIGTFVEWKSTPVPPNKKEYSYNKVDIGGIINENKNK